MLSLSLDGWFYNLPPCLTFLPVLQSMLNTILLFFYYSMENVVLKQFLPVNFFPVYNNINTKIVIKYLYIIIEISEGNFVSVESKRSGLVFAVFLVIISLIINFVVFYKGIAP